MTALRVDPTNVANGLENWAEIQSREFASFEPDKASVAALSPVEIARLTRSELITAICAAELPVLSSRNAERLQYLDRWTLERLVHLARYCCRNQGY